MAEDPEPPAPEIVRIIEALADAAARRDHERELAGLPREVAPKGPGMKLSDFAIGRTLRCAGKLYRCTDVGTRVVVAIKLEAVEVGSISEGSYKVRVLDQRTAEANGWFNGPPYAVQEVVFDENDMEGCEPGSPTGASPRR